MGTKYSTLPERVLAYYYARKLREEKLGYKKIVREIHEVFDIKISSGEVCNWINNKHNPLRRCGRVSNCPELGYVLAAWLGDGTLALDSKVFKHCIILYTKDVEFAQEWGRCLAKVTGNSKPYKPQWDKSNERWIVKASNMLLWVILTIAKENPWFIYPILERYPETACRDWFDVEGCVSPSSYLIVATNTDIEQVSMFQKL